MEDMGCHPLVPDIRVAPEDLSSGGGCRNSLSLSEVLPGKQGVYFGRVSPEDDVLVTKGKDLRLDEIAWGKQGCDGPGFPNVV